jgi:hypothetical protein
LVVVANVQVRTLRTVVEKGFALMAIGRKLVGPKESGKLHAKRRDRGRRSGSVSAEQRTVFEALPLRKGSGLRFPHQGNVENL